ncbi:MAG: type VI secretion system baseplate subunit TssF [Bryobacterales bacterium]
MRDELLSYYERELTYVRRLGAEFAQKYPKIASRLLLEAGRCEDPHVERLIEAFALLAARVHLKLDDDFPQISQALLNHLFPHFLRPIPSATIVQFRRDPKQGKLTTGVNIPRGTTLYSKPVAGMPCKFRTAYDAVVWPIDVQDARFLPPDRLDPPVKSTDAVASLRLELAAQGGASWEEMGLKTLRFHIDADGVIGHSLYELLLNNTVEVLLRDPNPKSRQRPIALPGVAVKAVGFESTQALTPYPRRSFSAYRLLQEYFSFPAKFFFIDVEGLDAVTAGEFGDSIELIFLFSEFERTDRQETLEAGVSARNIRLGCAPAVNLFEQTAEPIALDQTHYEYQVIPNVRRRDDVEVFSVDRVTAAKAGTGSTTDLEPFYAFRHGAPDREQSVYWQVERRTPYGRRMSADEVFMTLVNDSGRPKLGDFEVLTVRCTCTNGDLPSKLPFGDEKGDFDAEGAAAAPIIVALRKPTRTIRPPLGQDVLWRLISHLSLNYLSLVEEGKGALQEILRLYDFPGSVESSRQIAGILELHSERKFSRVISENGISYVRGVGVEMELDEEQFVGGGVYLFSSVIEQFLGHYVTLNSFSQLRVKTRQRKESLREWAPRAGHRILL